MVVIVGKITIHSLNGWNDETKALELATNLKGSARSILADLDPDKSL